MKHNLQKTKRVNLCAKSAIRKHWRQLSWARRLMNSFISNSILLLEIYGWPKIDAARKVNLRLFNFNVFNVLSFMADELNGIGITLNEMISFTCYCCTVFSMTSKVLSSQVRVRVRYMLLIYYLAEVKEEEQLCTKNEYDDSVFVGKVLTQNWKETWTSYFRDAMITKYIK